MIAPTSTVLLEQEIHLSRGKAKEDELVDRGFVSLKVIRDTSRHSFHFVAHSKSTGVVFLNARPLPILPKAKAKKENILLLYLADFSTHKDLRRIFYFTFQTHEETAEFLHLVEPLYNEMISTGRRVDAAVEIGDEDDDNQGSLEEIEKGAKDAEGEDDDGDDSNHHEDDNDNPATQNWPDGYVLTKWW